MLTLDGRAPILTVPINNNEIKVMQDKGNKFELNFYKNQGKAPVDISIKDTSFFRKTNLLHEITTGPNLGEKNHR